MLIRPRAGFSEAEVNNLMAGLERVTEEQLVIMLAAVLGEVVDRKGPVKCLEAVRAVLLENERTRSLVA